MSVTGYHPGRLNPDNPEWRVTFQNHTASYFERLSATGGGSVAVHLAAASGEEMWCDLDRLKDVVKAGLVHEPTFAFKTGPISKMAPAHVEAIGPHLTAKFFAQEDSDGRRQVVVDLDSAKEIDGQVHREHFRCGLRRLTAIAGEGVKFEKVLAEAPRKYAAIKVVRLMEEEGWAKAQVMELFDKAVDGETFAHNGRESGVIFWPVPLRIGTVPPKKVDDREPPRIWPDPNPVVPDPPQEIDVRKGPSKEVDRVIYNMAFDRDIDGRVFVLARWNDIKNPPKPGMPDVSWNGVKRDGNGVAQDFRADLGTKRPNEGLPEKEQYVLIRRSDTKPLRGEVVAVFDSRPEAVAAFHKLEARALEQIRQQNLSQFDLPQGHRPR